MRNLVAERITVVPGVCGGRPTIRGMRITVADILELLAGAMSVEQILNDIRILRNKIYRRIWNMRHEQLSTKNTNCIEKAPREIPYRCAAIHVNDLENGLRLPDIELW